MVQRPGEALPRIIVNDEGYLVDIATGLVLNDSTPIEGTELHPAKPRMSNTSMHSSVKVSPNPKITWLRKRFSMVGGVRDGALERARLVEDLVSEAMVVFRRHGVNAHESQVRDFVEKALKAWKGRPSEIIKVLDRVLDVDSNEYLEERRPIVEALNEALGSDWLTKHHIRQVLREWDADGVIGVDEVYSEYLRINAEALAKGRNYPTRTMIELALASIMLKADGLRSTEKYLRSIGKEDLLDKLLDL
ncbi:MAG: hypothetical protein ACP5NQ_04635 [Vulcanisaeta sp.]